MLRTILGFFLLSGMIPGLVEAQIDISGQGSVAFVKSENGYSQYVYDQGRPTFTWRWDLFADAILSDNVALLTNFRMLQDEQLHIDYFSLRVSDIASSGMNIQFGLIDLPIGNLGERRFPRENPFYDLPLMNEHITSLCSSDYKLWALVPQFAINGDGVRILDQGLYDLGLKVYGTFGIFDLTAALTNGMVSETGTYAAGGLNSNSGFGTLFRVAATPITGLTIGLSYGDGPFMKDQSADSTSAFYHDDPRDYPQHIFMGDLDFSYGYLSFYTQVGYNEWMLGASSEDRGKWQLRENLSAWAYSAEARYALTPRLSVAARAGGLFFSTVSDSLPTFSGPVFYSGTWDHNVLRVESALAYNLTRELLVKFVYQWNRTYGLPQDPHDNLLVIQSVVSF